MKNELYQIDHSWGYTVREVNPETFIISYKTKDGFLTKQEAEEQQAKDKKQYQTIIKKIKATTNIKYTFTEFLEYWFDNIYIAAEHTSTRSIMYFSIQHLILPNTKNDVLLAYITGDYLNDIIERCLKISNSSWNTCKKTLRLMLKDAENYGYVKREVCKGLKPIPESKCKMELPNQKELKKLLAEAQNHPIYYFEILLALFAGLRQGEILGLKYSDFDRETQTVKIERQYTRSYDFSKKATGEVKIKLGMATREPKSCSDRVLKIPAFLFDELEKKKKCNMQLLKKAKEKGVRLLPKDYICISFYGKRKTSSCLTPALKKISIRAGIPPVRMHMLRHCFATLMIENGVPLQDIANCMGHSSILTTFNTYCSVCEARNQAREFMETICPTSPLLISAKGGNGDV